MNNVKSPARVIGNMFDEAIVNIPIYLQGDESTLVFRQFRVALDSHRDALFTERSSLKNGEYFLEEYDLEGIIKVGAEICPENLSDPDQADRLLLTGWGYTDLINGFDNSVWNFAPSTPVFPKSAEGLQVEADLVVYEKFIAEPPIVAQTRMDGTAQTTIVEVLPRNIQHIVDSWVNSGIYDDIFIGKGPNTNKRFHRLFVRNNDPGAKYPETMPFFWMEFHNDSMAKNESMTLGSYKRFLVDRLSAQNKDLSGFCKMEHISKYRNNPLRFVNMVLSGKDLV